MGYDELAFQGPQLLATADLSVPEATFHLKLSRDAWAVCSMLTTRTNIADTSTVQLLPEISPPHDCAVAVDHLHLVPLGYTTASRLVTSFREFLSQARQDESWHQLIAFEPLGFVIYGRWTTEEGELLVEDARGPVESAAFSLPRSRVPDWLDTLD